MAKAQANGMFSELTHEELNELFARLGSGAEAGRGNYGVMSEIEDARADVHRAICDMTRAEFAGRHAQAEAEAAARRTQAEAGDPEAYLDFL